MEAKSPRLCHLNTHVSMIEYSLAKTAEERVGHAQVQILDDLHVIGGNDGAEVAQLLHLSSHEPTETDVNSP